MSERANDPLFDLVREPLRGASAYGVPHPPGIDVKLDANELPWGVPPELREELARELAAVDLNRYPDVGQPELRAALADRLSVAPDQLLLGNGSDEIIHLVVSCFARPRPGRARAAVAFPTPSFSIFRGAAISSGCEVVEIPTDPERDFALDPGGLDRAVAAARPNVFFVARPNNPTGTLWPSALIADLARRHPDMVVVSDEAYAAFAGDSMLDGARAGDPPNLLVMQTLSKMGLAALRIGYLVGRPALLAEVDKVRPPYNVGSLHARAARWVLTRHWALFEERCAAIRAERARVGGALAALDGVRIFPSQANLILFRVGRPGDRRAEAVWRALCGAGVLIRCFDHAGAGPLSGCLRVTIGTPEENDRFLHAIGRALAA